MWSAHGGVTQKYYPQENGKSLEFMEVLIGIVRDTERANNRHRYKMIWKDGRNKAKSMIYRMKDWMGMTIGHFYIFKDGNENNANEKNN